MATSLPSKYSAKPLGWSLIALFSTLPLLVQADDYRLELRGGYTQLADDIIDRDTTQASATAYFRPVDTGGHPLAEAAFMERASSLTLSHRREDFDESGPQEPEFYTTDATLDYYLPEAPLFASLTASRPRAKNLNMPSSSGTQWSGTVGVTPVEGLLVSSDFYEGQEISDDWNLNARYVMPSRQFEAMAFEAEYRYLHGTQLARWSLDTYLDRTLSLGIGYGRAFNTTDDGTLELRARKFFTDRFSLSAFVSHHRRSDQYGVEAGLRF